jgi:uracil-DNA glycosylase
LGAEGRDAALRALGAGLRGVDVEAYAAAGLDPSTPVLGLGPVDARLIVLGRDPGREELVHRTGFIGAGGKKVRTALHQALEGRPASNLADHLHAGAHVVWINTVPFKPVGNKAWPEPVRRQFKPVIADLLVHGLRGTQVLALGREAALWFAEGPTARREVEAWWQGGAMDGEPRVVTVTAPDGASRALTLHALPHPSPLNATWASRFPGMMAAFLTRLGWGRSSWREEG